MITKEQKQEILCLVSAYATWQGHNEAAYAMTGFVSPAAKKREDDAYLRLKVFLDGLVEE